MWFRIEFVEENWQKLEERFAFGRKRVNKRRARDGCVLVTSKVQETIVSARIRFLFTIMGKTADAQREAHKRFDVCARAPSCRRTKGDTANDASNRFCVQIHRQCCQFYIPKQKQQQQSINLSKLRLCFCFLNLNVMK